MRPRWIPWLVAATCWFFGLETRAADLAVMPVGAVGLSPGEADALGALFAQAVARDAHVVVASPQETKPLLDSGLAAPAVARHLGASSYVQLGAVRVEQAVKLSGGFFDGNGRLLYQAEASGPSLDDMDAAVSALARALIWRRPVAMPTETAPASATNEEVGAPPRKSGGLPGFYGPKIGFVMPRASTTTFSPSFNLGFDARFGPPSYFFELGAGLLLPVDDSTGSTVKVTMGYLDMGASRYLWAGDAAFYLGGGVSPAFWDARAWDASHTTATCSAYAQLGLAINRSGRTRLYGEVRLSQVLLAVAHPVGDGFSYDTTTSEPYRPLLIGFLGGLGW